MTTPAPTDEEKRLAGALHSELLRGVHFKPWETIALALATAREAGERHMLERCIDTLRAAHRVRGSGYSFAIHALESLRAPGETASEPFDPAPDGASHESEAMWILRHLPHNFSGFATDQAEAARRFRAWKRADVGRAMVLSEGIISNGKGSKADGECG